MIHGGPGDEHSLYLYRRGDDWAVYDYTASSLYYSHKPDGPHACVEHKDAEYHLRSYELVHIFTCNVDDLVRRLRAEIA